MSNIPPYYFFAAILLVIWILSAIASAISKQKDSMHRQQARDQIERSRTAHPHAYRPPPPPQTQQERRLASGYAVRHPEMLAAPPAMAPRARSPMRAAPMPPPPVAPRRQQQPQQRRTPRGVVARPTPTYMPPPPIPVLEVDESPRAREAAPAAAAAKAALAGGAKPPSGQTATAPAIARWLKPNTLRQQFILTEIFQPPLAMRQERLG